MSSSDEFALPFSILRHFDLASSPYSDSVVQQINNRRRTYPGQRLFIDRLLEFADVDGPALYPPSSPADLRRLLRNIQSCPADRLKRDCFIYYLLCDYGLLAPETNGHGHEMSVDGEDERVNGRSDGPSRAETFMWKRCMPKAWAVFMNGYWALDHGHWDTAVSSLSDPRITEVNFIPEILQVLSAHVSPPSSACTYIHSFLSTTGRQLSSASSLPSKLERDIGLVATASTSGLSAAFSTIRGLDDSERAQAREDVWCWALGVPRVPCGAGAHIAQAKALKELLHLPLNDEEHAHLVHFLSHPPRSIPAPALALLHDLVALRLIHQGQYAETLELDRALAGRGADEERQRRREMVREFIDILPEAQKRVLRIESDAIARRSEKEPPAPLAPVVPNGHMDVEMNNSWVDVAKEAPAPGAPVVQPPVAAAPPTPVAPIPIRANLLQEAARAASPARTGSPFAGPPRFAPSAPPTIPAPLAPAALPSVQPAASPVPARVPSPVKHASSPFIAPPVKEVTNGKPAAGRSRQPRKMIVDDEEPLPVVPSRRLIRQPVQVDESDELDEVAELPTVPETEVMEVEPIYEVEHEDEPGGEETAEVATTAKSRGTPGRKPRRVTSTSVSREPSLPPLTPARRSGRARQSTAPLAASESESEMPPPTMSIPGSFITSPVASTAGGRTPRARMTRSASRAHLDEGEEHDAPPAQPKRARSTKAASGTGMKRSTRAQSELTDDGAGVGVGTPARRSTRRGGTAEVSERGSPTPSVASSVARSETGRRREASASATPRATRSRK